MKSVLAAAALAALLASTGAMAVERCSIVGSALFAAPIAECLPVVLTEGVPGGNYWGAPAMHAQYEPQNSAKREQKQDVDDKAFGKMLEERGK